MVTQWFLSEKSKKVETPSIFWKFSLFASILLFVYGYLRQDLAIMLGQVFIYLVYIRNLQLQDKWKNSSGLLKLIVMGVPVVFAFYIIFFSDLEWENLVSSKYIATWLVTYGVIAQLIFNGRFIYQWLYSEKNKESSLPLGFWLMSLTGAVMVFIYGFFRNDPVLMASHLFGGIVSSRNLYILKNSDV